MICILPNSLHFITLVPRQFVINKYFHDNLFISRYWNEFPRKEEWLTYADVTHILCLPDAECMFLWDAFANTGIDMMNRYAMFVAISM